MTIKKALKEPKKPPLFQLKADSRPHAYDIRKDALRNEGAKTSFG